MEDGSADRKDAGESWRPVVGYEGLYSVSDVGRVRSHAGGRGRCERDLRGYRHKAGYIYVDLYRHSRRQKRGVHALVLEAFVGPRPDGAEALHGDGVPDHNALRNLRWDTSGENNLDIVRHGRHAMANRTHCPQKHSYDEANTLISGGRRYCRTCMKLRRTR